MSKSPHDRFDDVSRSSGRVGAHRAEQPGINGPLALLWAAAAVLVLIVIGIFVSMVLMGRINLFGASETTAPESPGALAQIDTSYHVLIVNASNQTEVVEEVRQKLIGEGWEANAVFGSDESTSVFDETTVFYVDEDDEAAALGVAEVLGGAKAERSDHYATPNDSGPPQLTVVVGMDGVGTGSPAPDSDSDSAVPVG